MSEASWVGFSSQAFALSWFGSKGLSNYQHTDICFRVSLLENPSSNCFAVCGLTECHPKPCIYSSMSIGLEEKAEPLWGQRGSLAICVLSTRWRANDGDSVAGSLGLLQFCLSCLAESPQNREVGVWAFGGLSAEVAFKRLQIFLNLVMDYTCSETNSGLCQHHRLNPLATKQHRPPSHTHPRVDYVLSQGLYIFWMFM